MKSDQYSDEVETIKELSLKNSNFVATVQVLNPNLFMFQMNFVTLHDEKFPMAKRNKYLPSSIIITGTLRQRMSF